MLVSAAPRSYGTARIPYALAKAGFDVTLIALRGSLAEKSSFLARVGHLPEYATKRQWLYAFGATVKAVAPRLVVPGDEISLRLLQSIVVAPPADLRADLQSEFAALVRASLGEPTHYASTVDQTELPGLVASLGIAVAPSVVTASDEEAAAFADSVGYPVVVRRRYTFVGQGVAVCNDRAALGAAIASLGGASPFDLDDVGDNRVLVQALPRGRRVHYSLAAWQGELVAGWAAETVVAEHGGSGATSVFRYHRSDELRAIAATLARELGLCGIAGVDCVLDADTGRPMFTELARHVTPYSHRGASLGVDLCAALHASLGATASAARSDLDAGEEGIGVHFPQEWLRDPYSDYLRNYPVDVPWEEPELIEAMLALRHEAWPNGEVPPPPS